MTVGVVTTSFPRHPGDFAGGFVEDAVRALAATGETVEVIAAGDASAASREARPDLGASVVVHRIAVAGADGPSPLFYGAGAPEALERGGGAVWTQALAFWAGLCAAVRARAPFWTRVEAHWLVPCALAARSAAPGLPWRAYAHSGDVALLERLRGGRALARFLARGDGEFRFASDNLRMRFRRLAPGAQAARDAVDPIGALPPVIDRTQARRDLNMQGRTLLSVGRLVPIKGFDVLVRAAAIAAPRTDATTVVILGDGPERARLQRLAHRLNVDLRLPGVVPRAEVARWMAGADLYVQPSRPLRSGRTEGLPVATREALSLGLPVVASATGGLVELPHRAPRLRLVPPDDHAALADCLHT
ncbi:MAG TPA: glycosyltransferase [Polyangia bacterium]|nr:glycosyltransferase [Polyangia bacterium]